MTQIRFQYQKVNGRLQPIISIGLKLQNKWYPFDFYVDSGSEYSILRSEIADIVGFNYRTGNRISLQVGDGSFILIYLHELEVQLGRERFTCPLGFSQQLGVDFNVLGKMGIFDRFKICFQQDPGLITFES
ncbi:MAG: hypothetical protein AB4352_04750 [Hormoscilla sp.]